MKTARRSIKATRLNAMLPFAAAGIAGAVLMHAARAQSAESTDAAPAATAAVAEPVGSAFSVQLNFDYATAYFYHGIIQEDCGLILQPAAKITANLTDGDGGKLDAFFGTWNSFHGQKTAAATQGDFTEYWYESDLYAGLTYTRGEWSATANYIILTSPSDAYETVQELDLTLAFDDSKALSDWAMHPYATLGIETGADGSDGGGTRPGTYLELGVAPGFATDIHETPVTFSFPAAVGLSLSNYYEDASGNDGTFGFAQVSAKASVPLPIGARYGQWTLNTGVSLLFLGDHTEQYNGGDGEQVIGTVGLQLNF